MPDEAADPTELDPRVLASGGTDPPTTVDARALAASSVEYIEFSDEEAGVIIGSPGIQDSTEEPIDSALPALNPHDMVLAQALDDHSRSPAAEPPRRPQAQPPVPTAELSLPGGLSEPSRQGFSRLAGESWTRSSEVQDALRRQHASLQLPEQGYSFVPIILDEYSVRVDRMPNGLSPEDYLGEMARDLNSAVNSFWFNRINEFKRRGGSGEPRIGDIYDIDILGPDNGSVMLVDRTPNRFIFQTVETAETGSHPEFGSREFGFERNRDGSVKFYTRGRSRSGFLGLAVGGIGPTIQQGDWRFLVRGIGNEIVRRGGAYRPSSYNSNRIYERRK